jgi:4-hydroxybenzoate polyprenyltransferase
MRYLLSALRPKQWIKNLVIFLPLVFGKKLFDFPANLKALAAFFIFSLSASAVYLVNDILDLEKDRLHPMKRQRPLASGKLPVAQAWVMACILGLISISLSFLLNVYFGFTVVGYLVFNFVYTKILKEVVILDVFCIGGFFLLRIIAGSVVTGVEFSHWMNFMAVLLALFLGFNKRRQEIMFLAGDAISHRSVLAKYNPYFLDQMISVVTSSILVAYMLYTVDARTISLFGTKRLLYTIAFVYYGIFRYLYIIHTRGKDGDPTRILLSDGKMQLNVLLWIIVCVAIIYFKI